MGDRQPTLCAAARVEHGDRGVEMVDRPLLQEALRHVDQAAFALSRDVTEHELAVAVAELGELRALLSTVAFQEAVPALSTKVGADSDECTDGDDDDGPALVRRVRLEGALPAAAAARSFTGVTCWA